MIKGPLVHMDYVHPIIIYGHLIRERKREAMRLYLRVAELALAHRGWTMRLLAEHLEVDHQTVMYWNQGRAFPSLPMLLTICRTLGCTLDELVGERPKKVASTHSITNASQEKYPLAS